MQIAFRWWQVWVQSKCPKRLDSEKKHQVRVAINWNKLCRIPVYFCLRLRENSNFFYERETSSFFLFSFLSSYFAEVGCAYFRHDMLRMNIFRILLIIAIPWKVCRCKLLTVSQIFGKSDSIPFLDIFIYYYSYFSFHHV